MLKAEIAQVADGCDLNEKSGSWVGCYTDPLRRNPLDGGFFFSFPHESVDSIFDGINSARDIKRRLA